MKEEKFFRHAWMICLVLIAVLAFGGTNSMAAAEASKVSYTITNKSKKASYKNRLSANYLYQLPQLKGSSAAIKKINKSLQEDYKNTLSGKSMVFESYENWKYRSIYQRYPDKFFYTTTCKVTYNQNGYICFRFFSQWYIGGVYNGWVYGLTYRLSDGKKMGIQDVLAGSKSTMKKRIAQTYSRRVSSAGYAPIMQMKYSDFKFYIMPGKKVALCFGPYQPMGGNGRTAFSMAGKLK